MLDDSFHNFINHASFSYNILPSGLKFCPNSPQILPLENLVCLLFIYDTVLFLWFPSYCSVPPSSTPYQPLRHTATKYVLLK